MNLELHETAEAQSHGYFQVNQFPDRQLLCGLFPKTNLPERIAVVDQLSFPAVFNNHCILCKKIVPLTHL